MEISFVNRNGKAYLVYLFMRYHRHLMLHAINWQKDGGRKIEIGVFTHFSALIFLPAFI